MASNSTVLGSNPPTHILEAGLYPASSWPFLLNSSLFNLSAVYQLNGSHAGVKGRAHGEPGGHSLWQVLVIVVFTGLLSLVTVIGNILVMVSFKLNRQLKTVNNYFLLSLAVADLIIGVISMNLYTTYIVMGHWAMGNWACDLWLAIDYVASNASVMNLLVISFDRYFSITRPLTYRAKRTTKRAGLMIGLAWFVSLILWAPAILFWQYFVGERTVPPDKCYIQFLSEPIITFCTAMAAFYLPVTIMSVLYWRIYKETQNRSQELAELQGSAGRFGAAERPHFHLHATRRSSRRCSSFELGQPGRRPSGRFHCWRWRFSGDKGGPRRGGDRNCSDNWNNNEAGLSVDHSGSSDEDESAPTTTRAIFSIVLNLPGMRAAMSSQVTSCEDLDAPSEEDPLRSPKENDGRMVTNGNKRFGGSISKVQSMSGMSPNSDGANITMKSPSAPISFKETLLARRTAARARTHITKRKRMSLIKEKKAAQTLSAILFAFIITWTPYNIMVLVNTFCNGCIPEDLWALGYWLCYVNSTVNPMCYALCNKTFRNTFRMILMCRWDQKNSRQIFHQRNAVRFHRRITTDST